MFSPNSTNILSLCLVKSPPPKSNTTDLAMGIHVYVIQKQVVVSPCSSSRLMEWVSISAYKVRTTNVTSSPGLAMAHFFQHSLINLFPVFYGALLHIHFFEVLYNFHHYVLKRHTFLFSASLQHYTHIFSPFLLFITISSIKTTMFLLIYDYLAI